jgi:hypothetical protein
MICFEDDAFLGEIQKLAELGLPEDSKVKVRQLLIADHVYEIRVDTGDRETRWEGTYTPTKVAVNVDRGE